MMDQIPERPPTTRRNVIRTLLVGAAATVALAPIPPDVDAGILDGGAP